MSKFFNTTNNYKNLKNMKILSFSIFMNYLYHNFDTFFVIKMRVNMLSQSSCIIYIQGLPNGADKIGGICVRTKKIHTILVKRNLED